MFTRGMRVVAMGRGEMGTLDEEFEVAGVLCYSDLAGEKDWTKFNGSP